MRRKRFFWRVLPLGLLACLFLLPVLLSITSSLMGEAELAEIYDAQGTSIPIIPWRATLNGYYRLLFQSGRYLKMFWNSALIATSVAAGHMVTSIVVAYVIAKVKFRGRNLLLFLYIVVMMMPFQVTLLPNYMLIKQINLYNTNWALILPGIFAPFGVFLLHQFIRSMPNDVIEAVVLESNSPFPVLAHVLIPAVYPGILALTVLSFADAWNMVEQPLILLQDEWRYPLSLALNSMRGDGIGVVFAGAVLYMIPMIFLYRLFEDELITGLGKAKL